MDQDDLPDDQVRSQLANFDKAVINIKNLLNQGMIDRSEYDKLDAKNKIDYDLFMAWSLNSVYWMYLKSIGQDPVKCEVKHQLIRVREYLTKAKEEIERQTIRPTLNLPVAKRFIAHEIGNAEKKRRTN